MQTCSYCGADLPENTRFCGTCGSVQNAIATDGATARSNTPPPQSRALQDGTLPASWSQTDSNYPTQGNAPTWSPNVQAPETPLPPVAENEDEDERRKGLLPWPPLYDAPLGGNALIGNGQASTPGMPVVHGTPIGNMPTVAGSSIPNTNVPNPLKPASHLNPNPVTKPSSHLNSNPVTHPISHPAPNPITHPVSHPTPNPVTHPINHPAPKPVTHPINHPAPKPVTHPVSHPKPEPPGTQEHHKHHEHHTHHTQHTVEHVAKVAKVAGGSTAKTILLVVVAAVVVGAVGIVAATHFLLRPQPLISMTSSYKVGNALAGANGTILHISGQKFSSNSAITFLLDGSPAPGNPGTQSDSNGNFNTAVTITNAWSVGTHTLTAKDASNNSTKNSVSVTIVQPGQANTPGPDGAPPDDASFKVIAKIQNQHNTQETEVITGHPDPMGGTVCQPEDNGQPIVTTGVTRNNSTPFTETSIYSCTGNYKGGKLTLTEMFRSDVAALSLSDGTTMTCTLNSPQIDEQLSGSYTGNNTFSGTITYPAVPVSDYSCNTNGTFYHYYEQDNWTGQITDLQR